MVSGEIVVASMILGWSPLGADVAGEELDEAVASKGDCCTADAAGCVTWVW